MIGSLMYLTASRPDYMFAVCACSRFQVTPKTSHLNAVKRIFRYLKGKPKLGLWYPRVSSFDLEAYLDSDYTGSNLDKKSTTRGCQFLGRRLISWQCKKQTIMATSTTEAEYVAAANCRGQVLWIQNQMLDYGFNFINTKIYIDNESTICIIKNPVSHSKTKHIAIRHHFIRDAYENKLIQVLKIHTDDNVADLLTKAFDVSRFQFLVFWTFAKSQTINNVRYINAKVAGKTVTISEASIRSNLRFDDVNGIDSLNNHIFDAIKLMGSKSTSWDQIPTNIAIAVICLTSNQKFNFSKLILMLKNVPVPLDHFPIHALSNKGQRRHLKPQPTPSPPHPSEAHVEPQSNPSPGPSPTIPIPDPIPEGSGGNLGSQSSSDKSLSGNDLDMDIDDTMDYTLAQDEGKTDKVDEKGESTAQQQSTDRQDEGTDMPKVSTARTKLSTDKVEEGTAEPEPRESTSSAAQTTPTPTPTTFGDDETIAQVLLNMSQAKAVSKEKEKGVEIRNAENAERPRTTSTRSVLTLKPLPKIDPNDKGKKRIEEDEESDTESEEITKAKKKFDQIAHDEEVARKI
ncbi:hypothetical protein Tco_1317040 [Tanacetum coccineum]